MASGLGVVALEGSASICAVNATGQAVGPWTLHHSDGAWRSAAFKYMRRGWCTGGGLLGATIPI